MIHEGSNHVSRVGAPSTHVVIHKHTIFLLLILHSVRDSHNESVTHVLFGESIVYPMSNLSTRDKH